MWTGTGFGAGAGTSGSGPPRSGGGAGPTRGSRKNRYKTSTGVGWKYKIELGPRLEFGVTEGLEGRVQGTGRNETRAESGSGAGWISGVGKGGAEVRGGSRSRWGSRSGRRVGLRVRDLLHVQPDAREPKDRVLVVVARRGRPTVVAQCRVLPRVTHAEVEEDGPPYRPI